MVDSQTKNELRSSWEHFAEISPFEFIATQHEGKFNKEEFYENGRFFNSILRLHLDSLEVKERGKALDFGCGAGRLTKWIIPMYKETHGVDISQKMIDIAKENVPGAIYQRLDNLSSFADNTFDLVHTVWVLQHMRIEYQLEYIKDFFRITKPNGMVTFDIVSDTFSKDAPDAREDVIDNKREAVLMYCTPEKVVDEIARNNGRITKDYLYRNSDWCCYSIKVSKNSK